MTEQKWTELSLEERTRLLHAPFSFSTPIASKSWGGTRIRVTASDGQRVIVPEPVDEEWFGYDRD